jgi:signal peptidase I
VDYYKPELIPDSYPEEKPPSVHRFVLDMLETLALAVVLYLIIQSLTARIKVDSISMVPTLHAHDYVVVNKLAYKLGQPQRGDIIVFKNPIPTDPTQIPYIKRVIGLPGDQIHIADGNVYVNGVILTEPYLKVTTKQGGDWTVPEGSLFVMGDNRNSSSDSRVWGWVPLGDVIGKAEVIYWPPEHWTQLHVPSAAAAAP